MVLQMSRAQIGPTTRVYRTRKVVPVALRAILGKRELVQTLRTKDPAEARLRQPLVLARFEATLSAARAELAGRSVRLSPRDVAALAGIVYREAVELAEADPGCVVGRGEAHAALLDRLTGGAGGAECDDREFIPTPADLADARRFLRERGIAADHESVSRLAVAIFGAQTYAAAAATSRASGDWTPDPSASRFPGPATPPAVPPSAALVPPPATPLKSGGISLGVLLGKFLSEGEHLAGTARKREFALLGLAAAAGHKDADLIT
ncbi:MAG: phage integrase family protein, partial [Rhodospirillales bacterium]|nr:phage integrase family protein [Rhodospirillales bacterium]